MTDDIKLDYPGPRCIMSESVEGDLKIRIELIKYF